MQGHSAQVLVKDARVTHLKPEVSDVGLRHGCDAVWVYCGDKEKCLGSYKECWLKHLVRDGPSDGRAEATDPIDKLTSLQS